MVILSQQLRMHDEFSAYCESEHDNFPKNTHTHWKEYPWNEFYFLPCRAAWAPVKSKGNLYLLWGLRNMNKKSLLV